MIDVRPATLGDSPGITEVHCSDIKQWLRHGEETSYDFLTISERWAHGGPWMSVETCTIHINNLLLAGHLPLVATIEGSVIAEAEVYFGREPLPYGLNANVSVFYVHKAVQGRGVGQQLLKQAIHLCIQRGCQSITIHNPAEDAINFYIRSGFRLYQEYDEYVVKTKPHEGAVEYRGFPTYEDIWELPLQLGRYQSQRECYDILRWEQSPGALALPGLRSRGYNMNAWLPLAQGRQAFLALRPIIGVNQPRLYLYTPEIDSGLVARVLSVVNQQSFGEATLLLEAGTEGLLRGVAVLEKRRGQKVLIFSS